MEPTASLEVKAVPARITEAIGGRSIPIDGGKQATHDMLEDSEKRGEQ